MTWNQDGRVARVAGAAASKGLFHKQNQNSPKCLELPYNFSLTYMLEPNRGKNIPHDRNSQSLLKTDLKVGIYGAICKTTIEKESLIDRNCVRINEMTLKRKTYFTRYFNRKSNCRSALKDTTLLTT